VSSVKWRSLAFRECASQPKAHIFGDDLNDAGVVEKDLRRFAVSLLESGLIIETRSSLIPEGTQFHQIDEFNFDSAFVNSDNTLAAAFAG